MQQTDTIKFSIVTPVYNSEAVINDLIKSVIEQGYQNWEMIIQDGQSSDNTLEILNYIDDERIRVYSEKDKGMYDALNKAIDKAAGEYILHLNSDEQLMENSLSEIVDCIDKNPSHDVYCFGTIVIDKNYIPRVFRTAYPQNPLLIKLFNFDIFTAGIVYKRKIFYELSFSSQYKAISDAILFINILKGYNVFYSDVYTSLFFIGGDNLSLDLRAKNERESLVESVGIPKYLLPVLKVFKKLRKVYYKTFIYNGPKKITLYCNGSKQELATDNIKFKLDWSVFK